MPAELNMTNRYPCEHAGCTRRFSWRAEREQHYQEAHVPSQKPLDGLATISEALPSEDHYGDLRSLESGSLSDDSQATREPTKESAGVRCTYKDCGELFSNEEDMINHKLDAPQHDYCPTCPQRDEDGHLLYDEDGQPLYGIDCEDWDDFVKHKAENPRHISCPCCGQDFKSNAGLKHHVKHGHPKQQTVVCPGCGTIFNRAMGLIKHFEWGTCQNPKNPGAAISKQQFDTHVARKVMIKYLLDNAIPEKTFDPEVDAFTLSSNEPAGEDDGRRLGSSPVGYEDDGVLLDKPVEETHQLKRPLLPQTTRSQGLGAGLALDAIPSLIPTPAIQQSTKRPILASKSTISPWNFEAQKRAIDAQYGKKTALSPAVVAPTPSTPKHPIVQNAMDLGIELFSTKFWDPKDKDFSIDVFLHATKASYMCPYPTCDMQPKTKEEFVAHLKHPHTLRRVRCPTCSKSFGSCSALIGHCESNSASCRIRHSSMLKEVMDAYSGGFLSVKDRPTFRDEQWGDALKVNNLEQVLERERQDAARHLRIGDELTLQAQKPQIYW